MTIYLRALKETQPLTWVGDLARSITIKCLFCSQITPVQLVVMLEIGETERPDTCCECREDFIVSVGEKTVEVFAAVASRGRDKIVQTTRWRKYGFAVKRGKIVQICA